MQPTPYPDVNALVDLILAGIQQIVGPKLVGLSIFGSLAAGDFDPGTSDVDLLAALTADLDDAEFDGLLRMQTDVVLNQPQWDNRIEIIYVAVAKLRRLAPHHTIARISPGEPFHITEAGPHRMLDLSVLRHQGITLAGPPPATLIDPISRADLVRALDDVMRDWRQWITETDLSHQRSDQAYMILTMCRALYTFRHGESASKRRAATWAMQTFPEWSTLIRDALIWRQAADNDHGDGDATLPRTLQFVHFAMDTFAPV